MATLGGVDCFGVAVHVVHDPEPVAEQLDSFFGVTGVTSLYGGGRGRVFKVDGIFVGPDIPTVLSCEAVLLTFADGVARTFVDSQGRAWPNVIFEGTYRPNPAGPYATDQGWCLPYSCELRGLS